ncbi:oxidoreductase [Roseobacter weihaiensis]|uniref:oxidoreductase n=1 Tax=Roseobacter weihaiensis TaxID=2763262 RepID=UPI001D0B440F|nr:FAD-dependent oxidoreductase [Roseobacter sp. H9]
MTRDPQYDILFEPIKIGPVTARNRFFQVPHCTGMGFLRPRTLAAMRGVKAEGGWGVICTEYNSIHPSSDDLPGVHAALWDDSDVRANRLMTDAVHEHGALAGAELWYGGARSANLYSRMPAMDVASLPNLAGHPFQTRAMDKTDIRNLRRWHRKAALRARDAGFDVVYVYATHGYLLANFLDPRINTRGDEYGGNLENRVRLVRELIEETKEAVGDRCAVAVRFKADDTIGEDGVPEHGERREMFEILQALPDLWDINIADYTLEMGMSRFAKEGALEPYMAWVKSITDKPVVTVGRFTSPDTMVSQIKRGITDFIGAARPSIADPYIPKKIEEGRPEDIRECIGCNICYSGDSLGVPIRCTQNPTMGEEWRKGWHPEKMPAADAKAKVLIVGAGPAGLEAARVAGAHGHNVMLAEATRTLGGRAVREASLPGMSEYIRVRDYREGQLLKMPHVEVFRESALTADDIMAVEADHVAIATGASWRRDRFDGKTFVAVAPDEVMVRTPDDIMDGTLPTCGPCVVFDGDNYYMGGLMAEALADAGLPVMYVTEEDSVSAWAGNTSERWRVRTQLMEKGVEIVTAHAVTHFDGGTAKLICGYTGNARDVPAENLVLATQRQQCDTLYHDLLTKVEGDPTRLPFTLSRIGDCDAPSIMAAAVYAGHKFATEIGTRQDVDQPLKFDRLDVGAVLPPTPGAPNAAFPPPVEAAYLETLLTYYEEEVAGIAYYQGLAEICDDPDHKAKMLLLAGIEERTAGIVKPLIDAYGLTPRTTVELRADGLADAASGPQDFAGMIAYMRRTFPAYIADFERLERMAPSADLPILKRMTEHEVVAIAFLELEAKGAEDSTAPLHRFLATCTAA